MKKNQNVTFFAIVILAVVMLSSCGAKRQQVVIPPPAPAAQAQTQAPTPAPVPATSEAPEPALPGLRARNMEEEIAPLAQAPVATVPAQAEPAAVAQARRDSVQGTVNIPPPKAGQQSSITEGQVIAAVDAISHKFGDQLNILREFRAEIASINGDDRPQLEVIIRKYLTAEELQNLRVQEPQFTPNQVEILKEFTPQERVTWPELSYGRYPIEPGKPFVSPQEFADNRDKIIPQIQRMDYDQAHLEAFVKGFVRCTSGGANFWLNNHFWKMGWCKVIKGGDWPKIEQTRGGGTTRNAKNVKCLSERCGNVDILAYFIPEFGMWVGNAYECRGNPVVPFQRLTTNFRADVAVPECKVVSGPTSITEAGTTATYTVQLTDPTTTTGTWRLNGEALPVNGLSIAIPTEKFRKGKNRLSFDGLLRSQFDAKAGTAKYPVKCEIEIDVNIPEPPACLSSEVRPSVVQSAKDTVTLSATASNAPERNFIPVAYQGNREIARGQRNQLSVQLRVEQIPVIGEPISFRAVDEQTGKVLFECPGSVETTRITVLPPPAITKTPPEPEGPKVRTPRRKLPWILAALGAGAVAAAILMGGGDEAGCPTGKCGGPGPRPGPGAPIVTAPGNRPAGFTLRLGR